MLNPAFNTMTDAVTRRNVSAQMQKKAEEKAKEAQKKAQRQKEQQKKAQENAQDQKQSSSSSQPSSQTDQQQNVESAQQNVDVSKTPTQPVISSEVKSQLSASSAAISAQLSSLSSVVDASKLVDELNGIVSGLCAPIYAVLDTFKTLPLKLRSIVDVEGAATGMYSSLTSIADTLNILSTTYTSAEVPIALDDYVQSPAQYPKLQALQKKNSTITEGDCLSSGYTKVVLSAQTQMMTESLSKFFNPESQDTVAKNCEKVFESTVKTAWSAIQPPIQTVASIANIGPIEDMVQGVISLVDGVVQMASTPVPEEKLGQKIKEREVGGTAIANEAEKAKSTAVGAAKATQQQAVEQSKKMLDTVKTSLDEQKKAIQQSAVDAFSKFKMPPLLDDIETALEDTWKSVQMVAANFSNILIVVLFKLLECVFKCFNDILGVLGVPTLPYPLNIVPTLILNATDILTFALGLPMSLYNQMKAIVLRKFKATAVDSMPTPPKPMPEVVAIAPTSEDVPKVDATWKDVEDALKNRWNFSALDASKIVESIQQFFDGSDSESFDINDEGEEVVTQPSTPVLIKTEYIESIKPNEEDTLPVFDYLKRSEMLPQVALEEWLPKNIQTNSTPNVLLVPEPHVPNPNQFYRWVDYPMDGGNVKWKKQYIAFPIKWEYQTYAAQ